jgi:hypothetical protein
MNIILVILLVLVLLGALGGPVGWYGPGWTGGPYYYGGFGLLGTVLIILLILALVRGV